MINNQFIELYNTNRMRFVNDKLKKILTGYGIYEINKKIRYYVRRLKEEHNLCDTTLLYGLIYYYITNELEDKFDPDRSTFEVYLRGITLNWLRSEFRMMHKQKNPVEIVDVMDDNDIEIIPEEQPTSEEIIITSELTDLIKSVFDEVDWSVAYEGMSYKEASKLLGITEKAYEKHYNRKKDKLRELLIESGYSPS